jgi:hypothetical protein
MLQIYISFLLLLYLFIIVYNSINIMEYPAKDYYFYLKIASEYIGKWKSMVSW